MRRLEALRLTLIDQFGGACQHCGYRRCLRALHFHHIDAATKKDWPTLGGKADLNHVQAHPEHFAMLCANCHIEEHERLARAQQTYAPCSQCGKQFRCQPHRYANGHKKYCSMACRDKARQERAVENTTARFWGSVNRTADCWEWTGATLKGLPVFSLPLGPGRTTVRSARRVSYQLRYGRDALTPGQPILVVCDNPLCIRPEHLIVGTHAAKAARTARAGRTTRGERSASAKLTTDMVVEIRTRYAAGKISQAKLAKEFGLAQATVSELLRRETWHHTP